MKPAILDLLVVLFSKFVVADIFRFTLIKKFKYALTRRTLILVYEDHLLFWIVQFLINRLERIVVNNIFSIILYTNFSQECISFLPHFILYTNSCGSNHDSQCLVVLSDDTALLILYFKSTSLLLCGLRLIL